MTLLHSNCRRLPLGRFVSVLSSSLSIAVTGIVLTAAISSFATAEEPAVSQEKPKITFKGKVLNPDGTPADLTRIFFRSVAVYKDTRTPAGQSTPAYSTKAYHLNDAMAREGKFEFSLPVADVPAGANAMIYAQSFQPPGKFVSEPLVFLAEKDREDITIQLQEGILVNGMAIHDNGTPIVDQKAMAFRPVTPLIGADKMEKDVMDDFCLRFETPIQADGTFDLYLPPGDFMVKLGDMPDDASPNYPVSVKDREQKYRVLLVLPRFFRGIFVKDDGSPPGVINGFYVHKSERGVAVNIPSLFVVPKGGFSLIDGANEGFIVALTRDGLFGTIHPISADTFQMVTLKPTATVKVQLYDSSERLLAKQRIQIMAGAVASDGGGVWGGLSLTTTDADGVATFRLPPGTASYRLSCDAETMMIDQTLESGETIDLGTVKMEKKEKKEKKE